MLFTPLWRKVNQRHWSRLRCLLHEKTATEFSSLTMPSFKSHNVRAREMNEFSDYSILLFHYLLIYKIITTTVTILSLCIIDCLQSCMGHIQAIYRLIYQLLHHGHSRSTGHHGGIPCASAVTAIVVELRMNLFCRLFGIL